ncbi:uncharacterized protein LOC132701425 [Cylas formicarius]|uniref:uncharacterized protein LOC132701425 n=1 Tax=Cylas formicarius TaxID=197179 RepID=UPI002958DF07|nr:uncharacterized protein LOC132701425 [Cylas formicarius]
MENEVKQEIERVEGDFSSHSTFDDSDADPEFFPDRSSSDSEIEICKFKKKITVLQNIRVQNSEESQPDSDETTDTKINTIKALRNTKENKKYTRKKDLCFFCESDVQNFHRHIERNHPYELEVLQIVSKPKKSEERRKLLALLKKKGNFIKNSEACVKPMKEAREPKNSFLPCTNCCIAPKHYDKLVEATKSVARFDSIKEVFVAPTYAMNISTSLRQCCDIATYMTIKSEPSVETANIESRLKTMVNLLASNWRFDISSRAGNDLNISKFNKITIVPLASDLKLLKEYLMSTAKEAANLLSANAMNVNAFLILMETVYCRIILLNRRRPGELQRLLKDTYVASEKSSNSYEEFSEVMSKAEKNLLQHFKRIVIRGKRGRGVPVIFSHDVQVHIDQLLQARSNFVNDNNRYLFANPNTNTPICGYKVVAKYAKGCGAKNLEAITCTRLRKHLATLTQLFNRTENEIEQLSNFMGHTSNTAKISKLLLLMEKGEAGVHKGKRLAEITIDLVENLSNEKTSEDEDLETSTKTSRKTEKETKDMDQIEELIQDVKKQKEKALV